jgi:uncharacterized membrane-anchored protein YhcB (DUF1043 family)
VHYLVLARLAAGKELAKLLPQEERELQTIHKDIEDLHIHLEKATAALETSHCRQTEIMVEKHRKDLSDLYQQLQKDAQADWAAQAEAHGKDLRELRELLRDRTPKPLHTATSKPSAFTPLKAFGTLPIRPASIFKLTRKDAGVMEADRGPLLISFSPPQRRWIRWILTQRAWLIVSGHLKTSIQTGSRKYRS